MDYFIEEDSIITIVLVIIINLAYKNIQIPLLMYLMNRDIIMLGKIGYNTQVRELYMLDR